MNASTGTVFVVDDDEAVCKAVCRLLLSMGLPARAYASAQQFLDAYQNDEPGCLVLDVRMPSVSGLELQEMLAAKDIHTPIVFVTGHGDVPMSVRAMKAGAMDFIQKPFSDQVLLDAVQKALTFDEVQRRKRAERLSVQHRFERLTPREREVCRLVVAGRLNKQIAAELHASEKTIKVHRGRVMKKMEAESLAQLVLLAGTIGITETTPTPNDRTGGLGDQA